MQSGRAAVIGVRERREDPRSRRRDVVEDGIAVRVVRHVPELRERADADDVRQSRGVARVRPRLRERLVAVADRGDEHRALRVRVGDRLRLERRVGVAVRAHGVADAAETEVDHAGAAVGGPADRLRLRIERDRPVRFDDLCDEELRGVGDADDPLRVEVRGDLAGDEGAVPFGVDARVAADEAANVEDAALEVRERAVDAGVDDRDLDRLRGSSAARPTRRTRGRTAGTTAWARADPSA